jgi:hypothetical protein
LIALVSVAVFSGAMLIASQAQTAAANGPAYTADGKLEFPQSYRSWIYLTSGMDMSYTEGAAPATSLFDNVFVNPEAHEAFLRTGTWPDKTVLVLELRRAGQNGSINKRGHFQTAVARTEVHVKDAARFNGGWGFFRFNGEPAAAVIPRTADCYSCHRDHGAVDTTFVQFYPTLLPVARAKNTLSPGYLADEARATP